METPQTPVVAAIVRDLLFSSKITGTAKAMGTSVRVVRDLSQLGNEVPKLLLIDLSVPGIIDSVKAWPGNQSARIVGFVSHVDTSTIAAAREAGIQVMARGGFVEALPQLLTDVNQ